MVNREKEICKLFAEKPNTKMGETFRKLGEFRKLL